ncbi:hypothetical protein [Rhodovulum marinum]|uniref:Uncharacterized protein n=1 Tax=Rhodovulum marinum TaxID=320662 RepID=A0A4R2PXS0_9RHOB|nr:hypothetical protein [Rhodovulum marinum]TCP39958.1 hypothetical protein EV662_10983 [Rhodovulum marinum]
MRFAVALACAALALAAPAKAQTFEEAVRANMGLGLRLCLAGGGDMAAWVASFRAAGFAERVEWQGNGDTTHHFTAPADTATVELYYGQMPEECTVTTAHMGVTRAAQVLDEVVPQVFPTFVRVIEQGAVDPATGRPALCVRYEDPANPIGLVIGAWPGNEADACVENGTSILYQSYRV